MLRAGTPSESGDHIVCVERHHGPPSSPSAPPRATLGAACEYDCLRALEKRWKGDRINTTIPAFLQRAFGIPPQCDVMLTLVPSTIGSVSSPSGSGSGGGLRPGPGCAGPAVNGARELAWVYTVETTRYQTAPDRLRLLAGVTARPVATAPRSARD